MLSSVTSTLFFTAAAVSLVSAQASPIINERATGCPVEFTVNTYTGLVQYHWVYLFVGSTSQSLRFALDTSSSVLWANPNCDWSTDAAHAPDRALCHSLPRYAPINSTVSSATEFSGAETYLDEFDPTQSRDVEFTYYSDSINAGGYALHDHFIGVATGGHNPAMGTWGLANNPTNEFGSRASIQEALLDDGTVNTTAFSLDIRDDGTGTLIIGALDIGKFIGDLASIPMQASVSKRATEGSSKYTIMLLGLIHQLPYRTDPVDVIPQSAGGIQVSLNSASTFNRLPSDAVNKIVTILQATFNTEMGWYEVEASMMDAPGWLGFEFAGKTIQVSYKDFIYQPANHTRAVIALLPGKDGAYELGSTFMKSAYIVFDQLNSNVHLGTSASGLSQLVNFGAGADSIPSVSGVGTIKKTSTSTKATATSTGMTTSTSTPAKTTSSSTGKKTSTSTAAHKTSSSTSAKTKPTSTSAHTSTSTSESSSTPVGPSASTSSPSETSSVPSHTGKEPPSHSGPHSHGPSHSVRPSHPHSAFPSVSHSRSHHSYSKSHESPSHSHTRGPHSHTVSHGHHSHTRPGHEEPLSSTTASESVPTGGSHSHGHHSHTHGGHSYSHSRHPHSHTHPGHEEPTGGSHSHGHHSHTHPGHEEPSGSTTASETVPTDGSHTHTHPHHTHPGHTDTYTLRPTETDGTTTVVTRITMTVCPLETAVLDCDDY
ncbi:acid protease [Thozetella sp. PMI_491]|nr:acid protease [Thozetella sp. PMI_491]